MTEDSSREHWIVCNKLSLNVIYAKGIKNILTAQLEFGPNASFSAAVSLLT